MTYYCIKQHDITDCGAACLATISKQYGLSLPISRIREAAGTDKQGTNLRGLVQAAERLGFTAKAVKGDQNALFSDFPLPAIAHVLVDGRLLHYVVIHISSVVIRDSIMVPIMMFSKYGDGLLKVMTSNDSPESVIKKID